MLIPISLICVSEKEMHVFSDALEEARSAVVYVRWISELEDVHVGFVIGKSNMCMLHSRVFYSYIAEEKKGFFSYQQWKIFEETLFRMLD